MSRSQEKSKANAHGENNMSQKMGRDSHSYWWYWWEININEDYLSFDDGDQGHIRWSYGNQEDFTKVT